jgi:hypothetical protein
MAHKLNCWEYKSCGRQPGGLLANEYGICPVARALDLDGTNDGQAGGRVCWRVHSRMANRKADNDLPILTPCQKCDFYRRVLHEQADSIRLPLVSPTL